jgi:hypothetical protein
MVNVAKAMRVRARVPNLAFWPVLEDERIAHQRRVLNPHLQGDRLRRKEKHRRIDRLEIEGNPLVTRGIRHAHDRIEIESRTLGRASIDRRPRPCAPVVAIERRSAKAERHPWRRRIRRLNLESKRDRRIGSKHADLS